MKADELLLADMLLSEDVLLLADVLLTITNCRCFSCAGDSYFVGKEGAAPGATDSPPSFPKDFATCFRVFPAQAEEVFAFIACD